MMFLFIIYLQDVHLPPPSPPIEYSTPPLSLKDYEVQRAAKLMMNLKDYEVHRAVNVMRNNEVLASLGVPAISAELRNANQKKDKGKEKMQEDVDSDQEYNPDHEEHSEDDTSQSPRKVCDSYISYFFCL